MASTTVVSFPNSGRLPVWTGQTGSGEPGSMLHLENRLIQVHFQSSDTVTNFTTTIPDSVLKSLGTFLYEFPCRHFGIIPDELSTVNFILPGINDNGPPFAHFLNQPIHHLRFSNPACIGRDLYHGCPMLMHSLALKSIQATELLYSHHHEPRVDIMIIKVTFNTATQDFLADLQNNFPGFQFDTPMMFRSQFKLHERNDIFRTRMTIFTTIIHTDDQTRDHILWRKFAHTDFYRFELHLNDELFDLLPRNVDRSFTKSRLKRTAVTTLEQVDSIAQSDLSRISTKQSDELFHYLMIEDPCVQILKDNLSLEILYGLTTLCASKIITTNASTQLVVKLVLSCWMLEVTITSTSIKMILRYYLQLEIVSTVERVAS